MSNPLNQSSSPQIIVEQTPSPSKMNNNSNTNNITSSSNNNNPSFNNNNDIQIGLSQRKKTTRSQRRQRKALPLTATKNSVHINTNNYSIIEKKPTTNWKQIASKTFNPNSKSYLDLTEIEKQEKRDYNSEVGKIESLKINNIVKNWQNKPKWDEIKMLKLDLNKEQLRIEYRWLAECKLGNWHNCPDLLWDEIIKFIPIFKRLRYSIIDQEPHGRGDFYKVHFVYHSNYAPESKIVQKLSGIKSSEIWFYSVLQAMDKLNNLRLYNERFINLYGDNINPFCLKRNLKI